MSSDSRLLHSIKNVNSNATTTKTLFIHFYCLMNFMKIGRIFAAQRKIINSDRLEVFYNLKQMFYTNNIQERKKESGNFSPTCCFQSDSWGATTVSVLCTAHMLCLIILTLTVFSRLTRVTDGCLCFNTRSFVTGPPPWRLSGRNKPRRRSVSTNTTSASGNPSKSSSMELSVKRPWRTRFRSKSRCPNT